MYYEINIALNGKHFFATDERSIRSRSEAFKVYTVLKDKFPKSEGYEISLSYWTKSGKCIDDIDSHLNEGI